MDKNTLIKVRNRDNGTVGYKIPDLNLYRNYQPGETKEVTLEEIQKLYMVPGGRTLLENNLVIENDEAVKLVLGEVEPEYNYGEEEIKILLSPTASLAQLKDALTFAPDGVKELIKDLSVKTRLNDVNKRNLILEKTGFDVTKAIEAVMIEEAELEKAKKEGKVQEPATRSAEPIKTQERTAEPIVASKYNVVK